MKWGRWLMVLMLALFAVFLHAETLYPFHDAKQNAQFQHLIADLRCPVCQNQNLADSNAPMAKTLREEVYHAVVAGRSDDEIIHDMTQRYGDYIIFKPPVKALTWLLWWGPLIFLGIGVWLFYLLCIQRKTHD